MFMSNSEFMKMPILRLEATPHVFIETALVGDAIREMNSHRLGICCLVKNNMELAGCFTDGDLRRLVSRQQKPFAALIMDDLCDYSTQSPLCIQVEAHQEDVLEIMYTKRIMDLPVVGESRELLGLVNIHDLIRELRA